MASIQNGVCKEVRLALGGVGPVPFRVTAAEDLLRQQNLRNGVLDEAAAVAADACDPISDAHASAGYRKKMARVFVKRALQQLVKESVHT